MTTIESPAAEATQRRSPLRWTWHDARRFLLPVLALALAAAALAALFTVRQATRYESSVTLVVQTSAGANDTETLVRTMSALVNSEVIGDKLRATVGTSLSVDTITGNLTIERPPGSSVMTIHYVDTDQARSVRIAQALIPVFQEQVQQLEAGQAGQLAPNYAIQPWGNGTVITTDLPAPILRNASVAALLGALLGAIGAAAVRQRNRNVRTEEEAALATQLPVVPAARALAGTRPGRSAWHPTDVMDALLGRLPAALGTDELPHRLLVVGPEPSRERTTFVTQLANALQREGHPTLLVDADLEEGGLSRQLALSRRPGLADSIRSGDSPRQSVVVPDDGPGAGLSVLPAGQRLPLRSGSPTMALARLEPPERLVINGPEASPHQSLGALIRGVDAVVVVAVSGSAGERRLAALGSLVRSLGVVPAVTVLLTDEARHASSRLSTRPVLQAQPSGAASIGG